MSFADMFLHVHSSAFKLDRHPSFYSQNWKFKMHVHDSMAVPQSDVSFANMASFQGLMSSGCKPLSNWQWHWMANCSSTLADNLVLATNSAPASSASKEEAAHAHF